jgi:hypothetical protein
MNAPRGRRRRRRRRRRRFGARSENLTPLVML